MELLISYRFNNSKSSVLYLFTDNSLIIKVHQVYVYPLPMQIEQRIQMIINKQMNFCFISRYFSIQTFFFVPAVFRKDTKGARVFVSPVYIVRQLSTNSAYPKQFPSKTSECSVRIDERNQLL